MTTELLIPSDGGKKSIPELSVDTQVLYKRLKEVPIGEVVKYGTLNALIGGDIQIKRRHILESARHMALRDDSIVFACVHGVGLKRLSDSEIANSGEESIRHISRVSRKAVRRLGCAKYDGLTKEDKVKVNTHMSLLGALNQVTRSRKVLALETRIAAVGDKLPLQKTLDVFRNQNGDKEE